MANFLDDIADYLQAQGIGTVGTNIFVGKWVDKPDNQIVILGQTEQIALSGQYIGALQFPIFEIMVRDLNYANAAATLALIRTALHMQIGITTTHFRVLRMHTSSSGYVAGDNNGRAQFSISINAEVLETS